MALSADHEAYLDHYGLAHDPFALRVPGLKFFPARRKTVLGQLHHLARYSQLLLAVTGPRGSGKSLLRQALAGSSNRQSVQCCSLSAERAESQELLLVRLAHELGAARGTLPGLMAQVGQASLNGQEVYLLIDDAHLLEPEALQALFALAEGGPEGRAHVFLFGEGGLGEQLESVCVDPDRYHVIELQPYDATETAAYLAQRIEGAGGDPAILDEEQVARIHAASAGWPGAINRLAGLALRESMAVQVQASRAVEPAPATRGFPRRHLWAVAGVVVAGGLLALLLRGEGDGGVERAPVVTGELAVPRSEVVESEAVDVAPIGFTGTPQPLPLPGGERPLMREPLAQASSNEAELESVAPLEPVVAAPVAQPEPLPPEVSVAAASRAPLAEPAAAPRSVAPAPAPKVVPKPVPSRGGDWYRSQPAGNYVVQVLGTRSEQAARQLVERHGQGFHYFVKQLEGKPLYVVTYGSFRSRDAAAAAATRLPAALRSGKPWARSVASVQQEMR